MGQTQSVIAKYKTATSVLFSMGFLSSIAYYVRRQRATTNDAAITSSSEQVTTTATTGEKGTDVTFHVNDLLREPSRSIDWDEDPVITREEVNGVTGAFILHNVLTENECQQFIQMSEEMGYSPAPLSILGGDFQHAQISSETKQLRDSWRVLCDMPESAVVSKRVREFLDKEVNVQEDDWVLCPDAPVNPRWRFNRYDKGQKFGPHFDAGYTKNRNEKTLFTFIIYLNEGYDGGETKFFPGGKRYYYEKEPTVQEVTITPRTGMALVFYQAGNLNHRHEGAPVLGDQPKYIIRSDIAYKRKVPYTD